MQHPTLKTHSKKTNHDSRYSCWPVARQRTIWQELNKALRCLKPSRFKKDTTIISTIVKECGTHCRLGAMARRWKDWINETLCDRFFICTFHLSTQTYLPETLPDI